MKYKIEERTMQDGFEMVTKFLVVDGAGAIVATCDTKKDARLEINNLKTPQEMQKSLFAQADYKAVDKEPERERKAEAAKINKGIAKESETNVDISSAGLKALDPKNANLDLNDEAQYQQWLNEREIKKASKAPLVWRDGTDRGGDPDRERYKTVEGGKDYWEHHANEGGIPGDSGHTLEYYTSNPDQLTDPYESSFGNEYRDYAKEKMIEAVNQLSPMQRKVWELCGKEMEISIRDAAAILKISAGATEEHYRRAQENIKKYVSNQGKS